jgi:hypothetical protein
MLSALAVKHCSAASLASSSRHCSQHSACTIHGVLQASPHQAPHVIHARPHRCNLISIFPTIITNSAQPKLNTIISFHSLLDTISHMNQAPHPQYATRILTSHARNHFHFATRSTELCTSCLALTHRTMHELPSSHAPLRCKNSYTSEERATLSSLANQHKPQLTQAGRVLLNRA